MMVPLDLAATRYVRTWMGPPLGPGLLALRHALAYRRPGLWGDHPATPRSLILVREGDEQLEAFGAGEPEPAVDWLVGQRRAFTVHAPENWLDAVRDRLPDAADENVETWTDSGETLSIRQPQEASSASGFSSPAVERALPRVVTRRLTPADAAAFTEVAPAWSLRGWQKYATLLEHGAAFGVPHGSSFVALGWVFDQADAYDGLAVFTVPRYRRLGVGRAVALALIEHTLRRRGKIPLWSTTSENESSSALARSLGFTVATTEPILRWPDKR